MKQLTYTVNDTFTFDDLLDVICADPASEEASAGLMTIYEPRYDKKRVLSFMEKVAARMPKVKVMGMTTMHVFGDDLDVPRDTVCSTLLFKDSWVKMYGTAYNADKDITDEGRLFGASLPSDTRGVQLLTSVNGTVVDKLVAGVTEKAPDLPCFGAQAGTLVLGESKSFVFCNGAVYDDGIAAATLGGSDLHVMADIAVGFRPLGRELTVTDADKNGMVRTIDGHPAASIYKKYLNVGPGEHFFRNTCEFPIVLYRPESDRPITRVPVHAASDGSMRFSVNMQRGDKIYLSYGKPSYLLRESLDSANKLQRFSPEAIELYVCINRRIFMGNALANREIGYFSQMTSDLSFAYGDGEICRYNETGSVLNSSLVCVGMREGAAKDAGDIRPIVDPAVQNDGPTVPLSERLTTFLEATSDELETTIKRLEVLARYDDLTGILNRRSIEDEIEQALKDPDVTESALIMMDIDSFKSVNDRYGHAVGDEVLKLVCKKTMEVLRKDDVLGRWGGEEFLCFVKNTSFEQACVIAERVREHIADADFGIAGKITVSVGVTDAEHGESPDAVFRRVDHALYGSKENGRNKVTVMRSVQQ